LARWPPLQPQTDSVPGAVMPHGIDHSSPAVTVIDYHRGVHPGLCRERGRSGARDHLARLRDFDSRRIFVRGRPRIRATPAPAAGRANPREVLFDVDEAG